MHYLLYGMSLTAVLSLRVLGVPANSLDQRPPRRNLEAHLQVEFIYPVVKYLLICVVSVFILLLFIASAHFPFISHLYFSKLLTCLYSDFFTMVFKIIPLDIIIYFSFSRLRLVLSKIRPNCVHYITLLSSYHRCSFRN